MFCKLPPFLSWIRVPGWKYLDMDKYGWLLDIPDNTDSTNIVHTTTFSLSIFTSIFSLLLHNGPTHFLLISLLYIHIEEIFKSQHSFSGGFENCFESIIIFSIRMINLMCQAQAKQSQMSWSIYINISFVILNLNLCLLVFSFF